MKNSNKLWFKAKTYGNGWTPTSWEGWLIIFLYLVANISVFFALKVDSYSTNETLYSFAMQFLSLTALLFIACFLKGEKPEWRWGENKKKSQKSAKEGLRSFTLIELMVAVSILSLLSSITFASVTDIRKKGYIAAGQKFESSVHAKIAADGLIAEYNFDEDVGNIVYDSSGYGQNLTLRSNPSRVAGAMGKAIRIDADSKAAVGKFSDFGYNEGAISFWVKPYSYDGWTGDGDINQPAYSPIMTIGAVSISNLILGYSNSYQAYVSFADQGSDNFPGIWDGSNQWGNVSTNVSPNTFLNKWNHVLLSWNTNTDELSVYINAKFVGKSQYIRNSAEFFHYDVDNSPNNILNTIGIQLGSDLQGRHGNYDLDRVRIYNKYFDLTN